ncbi:MAG: M56 family metallopeptidase [Lachnospiraceae bacterium]|nr:M56 family metallopeptidase [Lachnospiraceae bacterium]
MRELFLNVIEINIAVSIVFLAVCVLKGKLRKRYGAGWLKMVWLLLAVRLLIPVNFSLPGGFLLVNLSGIPFLRTEEDTADFVEGMAEWGKETAESGKGITDSDKDTADFSTEMADFSAGMADFSNATADLNKVSAEIEKQDGGNPSQMELGAGQAKEQGRQEENGGTDGTADRENENPYIAPAGEGELLSELLLLAGTRIWQAGMLIFFLYYLVSYGYFSVKLKRSLQPVADRSVKRRIDSWQKHFMGKIRLASCQSALVSSPMIVGILAPKLILPEGKKNWSEEELEFVTAHELCHYRNRDLWLKLLMTAACCVNWFNPLVFLLRKQFYYDLELACDGKALSGYGREERESYARIMLAFAGKTGREAFFSTGFSGNKKQMKRRIDYMFDDTRKRRGIISIAAAGLVILAMGLLISCGYQQERAEEPQNSQSEVDENEIPDGEKIPEQEALAQSEEGDEEVQDVPYDVNNEYNEMIRCHGDDIYIAREDGIYRLSDDGEEEELLYANKYEIRRGMELYQDSLYFCGTAMRGGQEAATIYRMDLNTYEVEDALALFGSLFDTLYHITIYEGRLYAASGYAQRIGFELDENGVITKQLDAKADDFLFKEDNAYWGLQLKIWNNEVEFGSEEYWNVTDQMNGMYRNIIDAAACERMLDGNQVVAKYKDELLTSIYLKKKDGDYEFLCDTISYPSLVTETGVYYFPDEGFEIWYVDYETKTNQMIWKKEDQRKYRETQLVNYDKEYIYFTVSNQIGNYEGDDDGLTILRESYLMRVPRWQEGKAERIYQFDMEHRIGSLQLNCAVADGQMFFNDYETVSLDPAQNHVDNSGESSEDAAAMEQVMEGFAEAYFQNDEESLRTYLSEDYTDKMDLYPYPEQAGEIEGLYISGLPDGNLPEGAFCYVSYEFRGNVETDEALSYLSTEMVKTPEGWKISFYGLEG